jgi:quercetin dioxygenase-like cupin family protein
MTLPTSVFTHVEWHRLPATRAVGEQGFSLARSIDMGELTIKRVHYSPGYSADHWCDKGHILFVLEGSLKTTLRDGRTFTLHAGDSYQVSSLGDAAHRSSTETGVELFIVE